MTKRAQGAAKRGPGRPPLPADERRIGVYIRVAPATLEALDGLAERRHVSRGVLLDQLVSAASGERRT